MRKSLRLKVELKLEGVCRRLHARIHLPSRNLLLGGHSNGYPAEARYEEEHEGYHEGKGVLELRDAHVELEVLDYPGASQKEEPPDNPGQDYLSVADSSTCI